MYSQQTWKSESNCPPKGKEFRKFRAYLGQLKMTPQGRTDLNHTLKHYEHMVSCDLPTQEKYEGQISTLQRQINTLSDQLRIANQTIHEGQDDETPAPVLHMMNRLSEAEGKHLALRNQVVACCVDEPDYEAIAKMAYEQHQATCPSEGAMRNKASIEHDIYHTIGEDYCEHNNMVDGDDVANDIDMAVSTAMEEYDEAHTGTIQRFQKQREDRAQRHMEILEKAQFTRVEQVFDVWRDQQCQWNSQYSIDDEVGFMFQHFGADDYPHCKKIFEDLYSCEGHILNIETKDWEEGQDDDDDQ